jgi:hypothetical protein
MGSAEMVPGTQRATTPILEMIDPGKNSGELAPSIQKAEMLTSGGEAGAC